MDTKRIKEIDGMLANQPKTWIADKLKAERTELIAPPVAAGSVDTVEFQHYAHLYRRYQDDDTYKGLVKFLDTWGAQQREQGKAEQTAFLKESMVRGQDEFNRKWTEQKERAEKAEARIDELEAQLAAAKPYDLKA